MSQMILEYDEFCMFFVYRRTDGRMDMVKPVYPPYNFVVGGIKRYITFLISMLHIIKK
jgi:hypothetical protein